MRTTSLLKHSRTRYEILESDPTSPILDSVGQDLLMHIAESIMIRVDTPVAVHDLYGRCAFAVRAAGWCKSAARTANETLGATSQISQPSCDDIPCRHSCWTKAAVQCVGTSRDVEIRCHDGLRILAVPILVDKEMAGSIAAGCAELDRKTDSPDNADLAKKSLQAAAALIGALIERSISRRDLRESETRHRQMYHRTRAICILIDRRSRTIVDANPAAEEFYGYGRHELQGMSIEQISLSAQGEEATPFEARHRLRSGEVRDVEVHTSALDAQGHTLTLATIHDVTERKKAQDALRESKERYRIIADFNHDWELWASPQGKLLYVSPSSDRITGFRAEEFLADPSLLTGIVHPDDRTAFAKHLAETASELEDSTHSFDFRIIRKDGEQRWINHVCQAVRSSDGQPLGRRISHRDVTDRKKAEEELRKSEERFRAIFENAGDCIFLKDRSLRYTQINPAMCETLGQPAADLIGREAEDIFG